MFLFISNMYIFLQNRRKKDLEGFGCQLSKVHAALSRVCLQP